MNKRAIVYITDAPNFSQYNQIMKNEYSSLTIEEKIVLRQKGQECRTLSKAAVDNRVSKITKKIKKLVNS